ncbi:MAG TPA: type IX secretion system membrane protein PorP/SprF [Flavobacteriia bacterium]|jgi:type IX secretion system PorP/SprF family membrane protein|nr:type IX secretion system membrane protein PorP/SprF [Flavobacteriia bacterium]
MVIYIKIKNKNMKKIVLNFASLLLFLISSSLFAQQPDYTHYMYNMNILNPAYAGFEGPEIISFGTLYRNQWGNGPNFPKTLTANINAAINDNNGIGLSFTKDKYGAVKQNGIVADYSYTINLGKNNLAFGLKAGIELFKAKSNTLISQTNYPVFAQDINDTNIIIGAGALYYNDHYYIALSSPNLLQKKYLSGLQNEITNEIYVYMSGGYIVDLSKDFKLKPNILVYNDANQNIQTHLTLQTIYSDTFEFGMSYRVQNAISAMFGLKLFDSLRLGYAYDIHLSDTGIYSSVTQEFLLNYNWKLNKKVMLSPRYF